MYLKAQKPPLGKLKPVPEKQRKTMFFSSPIDIDKWDRAKWRGVAYLWNVDAPAIGLVFQNFAAGKEIFYGWKSRYKGLDTADKYIKVDYIVPPFPPDCWVYKSYEHNFGKGYFVHIGTNIDAAFDRAANGGIPMDEMLLATLSRFQWMGELQNSNNRKDFFDMVKRYGKYYLIPVGAKNASLALTPGNLIFDFDCAIPMRMINATEGCKLRDDDPCKVVIKKPEGF